MGQKIFCTSADVAGPLEPPIIARRRVGNMFEDDDTTITRKDITVGHTRHMDMNISIGNILLVFILPPWMDDNKPPTDAMLFRNLNRPVSDGFYIIIIPPPTRPGCNTMHDPIPSEITTFCNQLGAMPCPKTGRSALFSGPFCVTFRALAHHARRLDREGRPTFVTMIHDPGTAPRPRVPMAG